MTSSRPINRKRILIYVLILLTCSLTIWFVLSCIHSCDARKICSTIDHNDMEQLELLLNEGAYSDGWNHTLLYFPIAVILEDDFQTPLGAACEKGNYEAVKLLLEHGADPNVRTPLGFSNVGAVYATPQGRANRFDIIPLLLSYGASTNHSGHGRLMSHAAFLEVDFAKDETAAHSIVLIKQMTDNPAGLKNSAGMTLLAACDSPLVAQWLIACGVNINEADKAGNTPLMRAVMRGNQEMVAFFLDFGAEKDLTNNDGKSAYDLAVDRGLADIASLLES